MDLPLFVASAGKGSDSLGSGVVVAHPDKATMATMHTARPWCVRRLFGEDPIAGPDGLDQYENLRP